MMKWIVIALALVNVGYWLASKVTLGNAETVSAAAPDTPAGEPQRGPRLLLLREVDASRLRARAAPDSQLANNPLAPDRSPASAPSSRAVEGEHVSAHAASAPQSAAGAPEPISQVTAVDSENALPDDAALNAESAGSTSAANESVNPPRQLLVEAQGYVAPERAGQGAPAAQSAPVCISVGPFGEAEKQLQAAQDWFISRGATASLFSGARREITLYWVYLPPFDDRATAKQTLARLQDLGVEDIYLITRGDAARAISLGAYRRKDSMQRRLAQMSEHGFSASVSTRYRTRVATWLDVSEVRPGQLDLAAFESRFDNLPVSQVPCA